MRVIVIFIFLLMNLNNSYSNELTLKLREMAKFVGEPIKAEVDSSEIPDSFYLDSDIFIRKNKEKCSISNCEVVAVVLSENIKKTYRVESGEYQRIIKIESSQFSFGQTKMQEGIAFLEIEEWTNKNFWPHVLLGFVLAFILYAIYIYIKKRNIDKPNVVKVDWKNLNENDFINELSQRKFQIENRYQDDKSFSLFKQMIEISFKPFLSEEDKIFIKQNRKEIEKIIIDGI